MTDPINPHLKGGAIMIESITPVYEQGLIAGMEAGFELASKRVHAALGLKFTADADLVALVTRAVSNEWWDGYHAGRSDAGAQPALPEGDE